LLHRTRADSVVAIYPAAIREFPSPEAVLERQALWRELTRPAGLAWRAESFVRACSELVHRHGNRVPGESAALEELPGIGHYVASAVVCFGFGRRAVLVDTNTIRLAARISGENLHPGRHRSRAVRDVVSRLGPEGKAPDADDNFALLDLAALLCTPREPRCMLCPLRESCVTGRSRTETAGEDQGEDGR
jgi:A/G-specific adenine glycosylase